MTYDEDLDWARLHELLPSSRLYSRNLGHTLLANMRHHQPTRRRAIQQGKHVDGGRWRCKSGGPSGGGCNVAMERRIECKICRLNACLRAGMRTDLVLDDKGKALRFRSFLQKQAGGGSGSDNAGKTVITFGYYTKTTM